MSPRALLTATIGNGKRFRACTRWPQLCGEEESGLFHFGLLYSSHLSTLPCALESLLPGTAPEYTDRKHASAQTALGQSLGNV
jgi:hypothetical protein